RRTLAATMLADILRRRRRLPRRTLRREGPRSMTREFRVRHQRLRSIQTFVNQFRLAAGLVPRAAQVRRLSDSYGLSATDISITNRAPRGLFASAKTLPSCSETMRDTIANPNPVPRPRVQKHG